MRRHVTEVSPAHRHTHLHGQNPKESRPPPPRPSETATHGGKVTPGNHVNSQGGHRPRKGSSVLKFPDSDLPGTGHVVSLELVPATPVERTGSIVDSTYTYRVQTCFLRVDKCPQDLSCVDTVSVCVHVWSVRY